MSWLPWSNSSSNPDTLSSKPENAEDSGNNALKAEASVLINTSSSDLPQPSDLAAHKTAEDVKAAEIEEAQSVYFDYSRTQRLGLAPYPRVVLTMVTAGGYGLMSGFYGGFNLASLKYLALNAHRLPKTKGGWYFYHKRKNYVVMREAFQVGFKTAAKYGIVSASYIGLEAYIDYARGTIDAFSTITAATVFGAGYAFFSKLFVTKLFNITNNNNNNQKLTFLLI